MYSQKSSTLFKKYALPQMIGLLLNSVYLIVDGIFIGNRLGRESMAAAAVSVPMIEILIALSIAVSIGAGIMVSSYMGSGEKEKSNYVFNLSLSILFMFSIVIVLFGNFFIDDIATLLGATPEIHKEAVTYLWYIITFSPALLFSFALSGFARNDNKPTLAMVALVVGSCSNIILDYVFMYPLNMGIAGAALATALGPIFSVIILLPHFLRKKGSLHFAKTIFSSKIAKEILHLGFPAFMMEFTIGIVTFLYNFFIIKNGFGEIGLAAYLTIGYLALIILTIFLGISQGMQPIISYFYGKKEHEKIIQLLKFSIKVIVVIGILTYILVLLFSKSFIKLFTPSDFELIKFTQEISIVYFCGFAFAGVNIFMITFMQSIKKATKALALSLLRSIILLPILIIALPQFFDRNAIWISLSVCEVLTSILAFYFYRLETTGKSSLETCFSPN